MLPRVHRLPSSIAGAPTPRQACPTSLIVGLTCSTCKLSLVPACCCRKEAVVSMEHENAFCSGPTRCISAATYLRLRFLDAHTISEEVRPGGWAGGWVGG